MSSFLCNHTHVGLLAAYAAASGAVAGPEPEIAQHLARANLDSVGARYGETHDKVAQDCGYNTATDYVAMSAAASCRGNYLNGAQAFGMARCSGYQSCDVPTPWDHTDPTFQLLLNVEIAACLEIPDWPHDQDQTEHLNGEARGALARGLIPDGLEIWEHTTTWPSNPAQTPANAPIEDPQEEGRHFPGDGR